MVQQLINGGALVGIPLGGGNGAEGWAIANDRIVQGILHALAVGHEDGVVGVGRIWPRVVLGLQPPSVLGVALDALLRPVGPVEQVRLVVSQYATYCVILVNLKGAFILQAGRRFGLAGEGVRVLLYH